MPSRSPGRPTKRILSREIIIEAAFRTLSQHGIAQFSMSRIARLLKVQTPALYNHVPSKSALIGLMRDEVAAHIDDAPFRDLPWHEAILPWARSYRTAFAREPELAALLAITPIVESHRPLEVYESIVTSLLDGGWPLEECVSVIVALENFVIGSAFDLVAGDTSMLPGDSDGRSPAFGAAVAARGALLERESTNAADAAFEIGIEALLYGLVARLARFSGPGG